MKLIQIRGHVVHQHVENFLFLQCKFFFLILTNLLVFSISLSMKKEKGTEQLVAPMQSDYHIMFQATSTLHVINKLWLIKGTLSWKVEESDASLSVSV